MNFIDYCIATKNYSVLSAVNEYSKLFTEPKMPKLKYGGNYYNGAGAYTKLNDKGKETLKLNRKYIADALRKYKNDTPIDKREDDPYLWTPHDKSYNGGYDTLSTLKKDATVRAVRSHNNDEIGKYKLDDEIEGYVYNGKIPKTKEEYEDRLHESSQRYNDINTLRAIVDGKLLNPRNKNIVVGLGDLTKNHEDALLNHGMYVHSK